MIISRIRHESGYSTGDAVSRLKKNILLMDASGDIYTRES